MSDDTGDITDTLREHYADHPTSEVDGTIVEADLWSLRVKERDPYRVEVDPIGGPREMVPPANCDAWDDLDALLDAADEVLETLLNERRDEYREAVEALRDD